MPAILALGCVSPSPTSLGIGSGPPADCQREESNLQACPGSATVHGIDVSTYQGNVSWEHVRDAGIAFAFARISDGTAFTDVDFATNWAAMGRAGLVRGGYQFFRASQDPSAQAGLVMAALADAGGLGSGDLPVVMDIETADGQSSAAVQARMNVWLEAVASGTGRSPIVYTNEATSPVIGPGFGSYALWVANWGASCPTLPAGWSSWRFWQYSAAGTVEGITGAVDLDEFDGTLSELLAFSGVGPSGNPGTDAAARDGDAAATEDAGAASTACVP